MYAEYNSYVQNCLRTKNLNTFKREKSYTYMLEHVSHSQGEKYLECIFKNTNIKIPDIIEFSNINDSVGNPNKSTYNNIECSPSNLRYIYHAHLILSHFKKVGSDLPISIVEIGGGYGGLYLAISYFNKYYNVPITGYSIVDLPDIGRFQELYLSNFNQNIPIKFYSSMNYGAELKNTPNLFLISNYCFSEIGNNNQKMYIDTLFANIRHGFIAWNFIPVYNFGFKMEIEDEVPMTGTHFNKYVRF